MIVKNISKYVSNSVANLLTYIDHDEIFLIIGISNSVANLLLINCTKVFIIFAISTSLAN